MQKLNRSHLFRESLGALAIPQEAAVRYLKERDQALPRVIYPEIKVIRADTPTQNKTFYPEASLKGVEEDGTGLISFIRPYPIPIIKDHNTGGGLFGGESSNVYGRVEQKAQFHKVDGIGYIRAMPTITDPEAIEGILTRRWLTTSLGSRTDSVTCSICGAELTEDECDHERGQMYEVDEAMKEALLVIGPIKSKEISFVLTPSDEQAGVMSVNRSESAQKPRRPALYPNIPSRILVGDEKGIWDLATGARVEERAGIHPPRPGRVFNIRFSGSSMDRKESSMAESLNPVIAEQFKGEGRYLLTGGWNHDHEVMLDGRGDGNSTSTTPVPASTDSDTSYYGKTDDHTHEVVGGVVRVAGTPPHTHYIEPAHAAMESEGGKSLNESDASDAAAGDDLIVSLGDLYRFSSEDPEFDLSDDVDESADPIEAKLTYAVRKKLPDSAFCGPDRSFPAHDAAHVRNGLARLSQSSFSSSQKASIRACLVRRAKRYGIKVSSESMEDPMTITHAAVLQDSAHGVAIELYPLPATKEALLKLLEQIELMPHTEEEESEILQRLAVHCQSVLTAAEWQSFFGELSAVEAGGPVEIAITAENYGLIYTALQNGLIAPEETTEENPCDRAEKEPVEEKPADPPAPEPKPKLSAAEILARVKQPEPKKKPDVPAKSLGEQVVDRVEAATGASTQTPPAAATPETSQQKLAEALAHSVALYQRALRKPQARDKSLAELTQFLSTRTPESLQDTLDDLLIELESNPLPDIARLPLLEDPVKTEQEPSPADPPADIPTMKTGEPVDESFKAGAVDEEEEVLRLVEDLFGNITAVSPEEIESLIA
jgi:hypothetical protein